MGQSDGGKADRGGGGEVTASSIQRPQLQFPIVVYGVAECFTAMPPIEIVDVKGKALYATQSSTPQSAGYSIVGGENCCRLRVVCEPARQDEWHGTYIQADRGATGG